MADQRAPDPMVPLTFHGAEDFADNVVRWAQDFALDGQRGQPVYIEVLCEAGDLQPRLARIASAYGVPVYSGAGFDGIKAKRALGRRAMSRDVSTVILHVGDRDDHGENIYRAAGEDAVAWAEGGGYVLPVGFDLAAIINRVNDEGGEGEALIFYRLALTTGQAEELELLDADGQAEVDGVRVRTMDGWLTDAIEGLQDPACREAVGARAGSRARTAGRGHPRRARPTMTTVLRQTLYRWRDGKDPHR